MTANRLAKRIERLEVGAAFGGYQFLFIDRDASGRFIDDATGKTYTTTGEVVDAKGLEPDRTVTLCWEP